jgi:hydroxymethylbilane synthase
MRRRRTSVKVRIGSRGSKLATTQAEWVGGLIRRANPTVDLEFVRIATTGDKDLGSPLQVIGGKGVFVKEIEEALQFKSIDVAVHSLKDVPQALPPGLRLGPCPPREDVRDVFVSRFGELLREMPKGSTIGTGSPRRVAQIRRLYWKRGYRIEPIRGNVDTRIKKVHDGQFDAVVFAAAGLLRLGLEDEITEYLTPEDIMPAPCQGCLGLELREDRPDILAILESIKSPEADITARAERAFLQGLGGDCNVPVAAFSVVVGKTLVMKAMLLDPSGEKAVASSRDGSASEPELVGGQLAELVLYDGGSELLMKPPAV